MTLDKGLRACDALRQQIYLGDDSFIQRIQSLVEPERTGAAEVPRSQRRSRPDSIQAYLKAYERDEAIVKACREGGHTLSAIAREVGLTVSRVSRIVGAYEEAGAKGQDLTPSVARQEKNPPSTSGRVRRSRLTTAG